jgi:rhomboid domain-containing protein 1
MRRSFNQRGTGRRQNNLALVILFDLLQRISQLEHKPPVTLFLIAVNVFMFYPQFLPREIAAQIVPRSLSSACLNASWIIQRKQWHRLILSAFTHADDIHLYYNMLSLLVKGYTIETQLGSKKFLMITSELLVYSHGLIVLLSWLLMRFGNSAYFDAMYFDTCAVGYSAVLFAYKVILDYDTPGYSQVFGVVLPTRYISWAELIVASLVNPGASFFGHLCGILAGYAYIYSGRLTKRDLLGLRLR